MQKRLHWCRHTAVPNRIADEDYVIIIKVFQRCFNSRIITLLDSGQLFLRAFQHGIVVIFVRRLRLDFQYIAVECCLNLPCHPFGVVRARSIQYQIAAVTTGCRCIGFIVIASRLFGNFRLFGAERLIIGTAAGYHRQDGQQ